METVDWLASGTVITSDDERRVISNGAVAVRNDTIVEVGKRIELERNYTPRQRLGSRRSVVMPGMIDCHSHLAQGLVRSLIAHELPMIYRLYLPAEDVMTPEDVDLSTRLVIAQLLRSGVTCVAETTATPQHEDGIVAAISSVGMRCVMARGRGDQRSHHAANYSQLHDTSSAEIRPGDAEVDLERTAAFLDRHDPGGSQLIKGAVLASHLAGYSPHYMRLASELARERGASLQIHVARDREEVELALALFGRRPVEQLAELDVIGPELLAIHAILVTDREIELLAHGSASVAHSPAECQNILNGVPRVRRLLDRGVQVGLGCDNAVNDLWEVMRIAWVVHSTLGGIPDYDPEHLPAEDIFAMATSGAARALGWHHAIGSLEAGKQADLVVVDGDAAHLVPFQHPVVELVRYGTRAEVRDVMVAGRLLLDAGTHTTIDTEALFDAAERAAPRIAATVAPRRYRPLAPSVHMT